jgi:putative ABC transport system permease protein
MWHNFLSATLRNFARNRFYTSINIIGLAIGLAVAILIALFVRNELSYDRFLPGYERTYLATVTYRVGAEPLIWTPMSQPRLASLLKTDYPAIEAIARLAPEPVTLRANEFESNEKLYWADASLFEVLPFTVIAGDPRTALLKPDGIVITRRIARKFFNDDRPLGQRLEINRAHPMQVTAVIEDLPHATHLDVEVIASGKASFSILTANDSNPEWVQSDLLYTYVRLAPGQSIGKLENDSIAFMHRRYPPWNFTDGLETGLRWVPIADVHFAAINLMHKLMRPGGDPASSYTLSAVAILVLSVAGINFVNLMTARASRRAIEVGVRKAVGGSRAHLILQFLGEAILQAAIAMVLAIGLVELLLPSLNGFLDQSLAFPYWHDPTLGFGLVLLTLILGVLAGAWPAFVLSAFSPATVLKSGTTTSIGHGRLREVLVIAQFAILIGLIVATTVIWRQMDFASNAGLRLNTSEVLAVATECRTSFKDEVAKLPGVQSVSCAQSDALNMSNSHWPFKLRDGTQVYVSSASVDIGFFELSGLRPIAGRLFTRTHAADTLPTDFFARGNSFAGRIVINESAVRTLGFSSPSAAIGQTVTGYGEHVMQIIGVVPDYTLDAIHQERPPEVYGVFPPSFQYLLVKLSGQRIPATLQAIDMLWKRAGDPRPMQRFFLDDHIQGLYLDVIRRGRIFAGFAAAAVFIACLGLFALSAFTAERRTKEIGVRKALGADRGDVLRLLIWQFTRPVLWANLIAWPIAAWAMNRWLHGFAYRVELEPWVFALATALALLIAVVTVGTHSLLVARTQPARALRYD